jgi:hypothetical protein
MPQVFPRTFRNLIALWGLTLAVGASPVFAGPALNPQPVGTSMTTVRYDTATTPQSYGRSFGYLGPGAGLGDIVNIGGAPNLGGFIAFNTLGRRTAVLGEAPTAQAANETLMRHGFYKAGVNDQLNKGDEFFTGIDTEGNITLEVTGITFDRPVKVREDTFLLHMLWDGGQVDGWGLDGDLNARLFHTNNHHLVSGFRDFSDFFLGSNPVFKTNPDNYIAGTIAPVVTQTAPNIIDVSLTFPYRLLTHLEDDGMGPPANPPLPAPGGFLEPFHFHLEYLVVPEPGAGALLAATTVLISRRSRRRTWRE